MKALFGAFNQEKALAGAFSVIVQLKTSRRFVSSSKYSAVLQLLNITARAGYMADSASGD